MNKYSYLVGLKTSIVLYLGIYQRNRSALNILFMSRYLFISVIK